MLFVRTLLINLKSMLLYRLKNSILLWKEKVIYKKNILITGTISIKNKGRFTIGDNVIINSNKRINPIGYHLRTDIRVLHNASLNIMNNVGMSNVNIFVQKSINIGNNVLIGGGTNIWDTDFHSIDYKQRICESDNNILCSAINIEDNVFIGANVTILKGVTIGNGAVIGASSVVSKSIPSNEIWAGNPIEFIKKCN